MAKSKLTIIAVAAAVIMSTVSAFAEGAARLQVSAVVPPFLSLTASQRIAYYEVGPEDVRKGYVDLPGSISLSMRTNINGGVPILVENHGPGEVMLKEAGSATYAATLTVSTAGHAAGSVISKIYDARIVVPPGARPGMLPFHLTITPL